jgi:tol-pal system protein YbgF
MTRWTVGLAFGMVLLPSLVAAGSAAASARIGPDMGSGASGMHATPSRGPAFGWAGATAPARPLMVAQADDPRIQALEEEVRQLTGKVEDLNFQLLKMQDQIQKMQQDDEFRFEQLEKGSGSGMQKKSELTPQTAAPLAAAQSTAPADQRAAASPRGGDNPGLGTPPRALGTIILDANGNVINSSVNPDAPAPATDQAGTGAPVRADAGTRVAALPQTDNPNVLYKQAYDLLLSGDYASAEAAFREHIKRYPADPQTADARYWLGESLYGLQRYSEAAQVFLNTHRDYPKARTAPEDMLKLGMSLAKLGNRSVACATLKEVGVEYPNASAAVQEKVTAERAASGC